MIAQSEIRQMPLSEKLALMEAIWSELASNPKQVEIQQWHKDILDERMLEFENGTAEIIDWEVAKNQIKKLIWNR